MIYTGICVRTFFLELIRQVTEEIGALWIHGTIPMQMTPGLPLWAPRNIAVPVQNLIDADSIPLVRNLRHGFSPIRGLCV